MKARVLMATSLLVLMVVASSYGQKKINCDVPFGFTAGGKSYAGGKYDFVRSNNDQTIMIMGSDRKSDAVMVITRIAGGIHTTPNDAHLVFDVVDENHILSEVWIPGVDGFLLASTKKRHEHKVLDLPVK